MLLPYLGCSYNDAAVNTGVHISVQISVSVFFRKTLRSGIGDLYGLPLQLSQ